MRKKVVSNAERVSRDASYLRRQGELAKLPTGAVQIRQRKDGPLVAAVFYVPSRDGRWRRAVSAEQVRDYIGVDSVQQVTTLEDGNPPLRRVGSFRDLRLYDWRDVVHEAARRHTAAKSGEDVYTPRAPRKRRQRAH